MSVTSLIKHRFPWKSARDTLYIILGALVQAFAMRLFLVPGELVSGGISGLAQIISHFIKFPIGVMVLIGNIPLLPLAGATWAENALPSVLRLPSLCLPSSLTCWCISFRLRHRRRR